jgi:hypothetical protein
LPGLITISVSGPLAGKEGKLADGEAGRPERWKTAKELEEAIESYFDSIEIEPEKGKKKIPPGIFALCVHTKMSYDTFLDYENKGHDRIGESFSETCNNARLRVMAFAETQIYDRTAGATFQLVNLSRKTKEPLKNAALVENTGPGGKDLFSGISIQFVKGGNEPDAKSTTT